MQIKKVLINQEKDTFYVNDISKDMHTQFGVIKAKDLNKKKGKLKTNIGKEFFIFEPTFIDRYAKKKRNAQIMLKKDIGLIITETGISKESRVVDAGSGSGALACFLANIAKEVITYEIRKDFLKTVQYNIDMLGLKNIQLKNKDIYKKIDEKDIDLITLDLPEPSKALKQAQKALKQGGFLVSYLPSITQVSEFVESVKKEKNLIYLKTVELLEREWKIDGRIARPEFRMLGHTGFLTFVRRV